MLADVFDARQIDTVVGEFGPEVVISLLITLPARGPLWLRDFKDSEALWTRGVPNLVAAAQRAGARRLIAESVIFAYGYATSGPEWLREADPYPGPPASRQGVRMLAALRAMEKNVLTSGTLSATEGIVLRYGAFYGPSVPHIELMTRLVKLRLMPVPSGNGLLSWIELGDLVDATVAALELGRGGQIYNIVDDHPRPFRHLVNELALAHNRPRPPTLPRQLISLFAPYFAKAFGSVWLPVSNAKARNELGWAPAHPDSRRYPLWSDTVSER